MVRNNIRIVKDLQYYKFCGYGFFKNLRLFEPFLILFFLSSQITFLQIGFLYSVREITRNILEIPAGIVADAMGRRRTMIFSFVFYILSFLVFYFSGSYLPFLAAMMLYALGDAFRTGTHKAMIFDYLKIKGRQDQKAHYYGHTRSFSQLGSALSSLIGGFMVFYTGDYRQIFLYTSFPYVFNLLLISSYPKTLDGMRSKFSRREMMINFRKVFMGFVHSFTRLQSLRVDANLSVYTGFYKAVKDYLQPVLQSLALSLPLMLAFEEKQRIAVIVGAIYFLVYLLTSYSSRKSGVFSARFQSLDVPMNLTLVAGLLAGAVCGLLFSNDLLIASVVIFVLIFMVENLRKPIGVSCVAEITETDFLATVLSAESQLNSMVAAVLAPLIGFLADRFGPGTAILWISLFLLVISPFIITRKKRT